MPRILTSIAHDAHAAAAEGGLPGLVQARALVSAETLARARAVHAETGERFDAVLTRLGLVSEQALAEAISQATGLPVAGPADYPAAPVAADRVTPRFLREFKTVILRETPAGFDVAVVDPLDPYPVQALRLALGAPVRAWVGRSGDVEAALERLLGVASAETDDAGAAEEADLERLKDLASDAPAIRAINRLIARAVAERASDIHLEPLEDGLAVRFRIDGELRNQAPFPQAMKAALVSRIKVMCGLNIAERRTPQDGRLRLAVRGRDVDLRVVTSPSINGEGAVLRLLDRSHVALDFTTLGFNPALVEQLRELLHQPNGIVLVTGPTGSGKTTTLYTALAELNRPERKILSIEDPIEYRLAGVNQTQVNTAIGLTFATALRAFLRQDPDVMMVGEIRDLETAQVAVQAALTGHTILSTLHTNSAASAVTRLLDMGIEPFLITSTVRGVLAQRLVRRLCEACREPFTPQASIAELAGLPRLQPHGSSAAGLKLDSPVGFGGERLWRPRGCPSCDGSGFRGRVAITELLILDAAIGRLVLDRADAREIEAAALAGSMCSMLSDGLDKACAGVTTLDDVLRAAREA